MAEFSIWHVLPPGEMPTVRQVLEMGGGTWICFPHERTIDIRLNGGIVAWRELNTLIFGHRWRTIPFPTMRFGVINPRPIEAPMPTPSEMGAESRWRVLCAHKPEGDACTLRTVGGRVEALFDGDDQWVELASQWGAGMVAVKAP